eukprot:1161606-Pelagomonas_calceolata.AAC.4
MSVLASRMTGAARMHSVFNAACSVVQAHSQLIEKMHDAPPAPRHPAKRDPAVAAALTPPWALEPGCDPQGASSRVYMSADVFTLLCNSRFPI